jgi:hypothetical protein
MMWTVGGDNIPINRGFPKGMLALLVIAHKYQVISS